MIKMLYLHPIKYLLLCLIRHIFPFWTRKLLLKNREPMKFVSCGELFWIPISYTNNKDLVFVQNYTSSLREGHAFGLKWHSCFTDVEAKFARTHASISWWTYLPVTEWLGFPTRPQWHIKISWWTLSQNKSNNRQILWEHKTVPWYHYFNEQRNSMQSAFTNTAVKSTHGSCHAIVEYDTLIFNNYSSAIIVFFNSPKIKKKMPSKTFTYTLTKLVGHITWCLRNELHFVNIVAAFFDEEI